MWKSMPSTMRAAAILLVVGVIPACRDSTAPESVYTLLSINGAPLPAPMSPGSFALAVSSTLTLYPDGRAVSRVQGKCAPLPPDALCDADREFVRTGTYSSDSGSLTFEFEGANQVSFGPDELIVTFTTGFYSPGGPNVWRYRR